MVEYGIMVALIAVVSVLVIGVLGVDVFSAFSSAEQNITPGLPQCPVGYTGTVACTP